jgi:CRISPR-associated protein Cas1
MRVTGTLYVTDHRAKVRLRRGTLVVEQPDRCQRIPIEALDGVVLTGRAEISNDAMGELARRGVRIAALSRTGRLRFVVGGPVSGNVHLRIAQLRRSADDCSALDVARVIVAGKLQNCRRAVQRWSWDARDNARWVMDREADVIADRVAALGTASTGDQVRGIEGDGTRRYFKCAGLHLRVTEALLGFDRRTRRPPRDPVNALLSFSYGLLLAELVGALDAVGLDPQIGFLHRPRPGRPGLALDLLEEFRPAFADRFAFGLLNLRKLRGEHFQVTGAAYYLNDEGRTAVLAAYEDFRNEEVAHPVLGRTVGRWALPAVQASLMARFLRGDLPVYPPYIMAA